MILINFLINVKVFNLLKDMISNKNLIKELREKETLFVEKL
jgi:hypothetical protein